jgi:lipopolysaccharide export system permease protein
MKILQRYFAVSITQAVAFVLMALLLLAGFMDLTDALPGVGKGNFGIEDAFLYVIMMLPGNVSRLMPVAALIGTIYTMAQFAASSEFTIMRASSMSTRMAAAMVFKTGIVFVFIAFVFGELITPRTAPIAEGIRLSAKGRAVSQEFRSGLWTKDVVHSEGVEGAVTGSRFFNVRAFGNDGELLDVKLYEFDTSLRLRSLTTAKRAKFEGNNIWRLEDVTETLFVHAAALADAEAGGTFGQENSTVTTRTLPTLQVVSEITPKILSVSSADPTRMSVNELAVYTKHLAESKQETDRFKIAFWKKLIDPLAIFVLMALALPFAYLQQRSGGVSLKIFIGIMIGVGFMLINSLFAHLGLLSTWPAFLTAIAPSVLFMLLAVGALWWVERH